MKTEFLPLLLLSVLILAGCHPADRSLQPYHRDDEHFRVVEESLYNRIIIEREGNEVTMRFRIGRRSGQRQTAVDLTDSMHLVIPYARTMLSAAWVQPEPEKILQIGLGGGALNRFLTRLYPEVTMETAELDEAVLKAATTWMGFTPGERDEITIMDGRMFVKRHPDVQYDWILLDAYREGTVPVHLKTREFYELIAARLAPGGVVAANIHRSNALYHSDVATFQAVFPHVYLFDTQGTGNVILLGFHRSPPDWEDVSPPALQPHPELLETVLREFAGKAPPSGALVLTDDYAPAEYLQAQER